MKKVLAAFIQHVPGVCYLYPFSTWVYKMTKVMQEFTLLFSLLGIAPVFYLDDSIDPMKEILQEYSEIIYDYNTKSSGTMREGSRFYKFGLSFSYFHQVTHVNFHTKSFLILFHVSKYGKKIRHHS